MYFPATDVQIRDEVIVFEGDTNAFSCTSDPETTVEWLVNGTLLEEPYPMGITITEIMIPNNVIIGGSLMFHLTIMALLSSVLLPLMVMLNEPILVLF